MAATLTLSDLSAESPDEFDPFDTLSVTVTNAGGQVVASRNGPGSVQFQAVPTTYTVTVNGTSAGVYYYVSRFGVSVTTEPVRTDYTYDALNRLKTADRLGTAEDEAFEYDAVGNRTRYTQGSLTPNANTRYYNYAAGTNRLANIRIGSTNGTLESSFIHNAEGRLIQQTGVGAKTLTWDAKGRLKTVGSETYSYDTTDHRIRRSGGALGTLNYFLEGEHLESVEVGTTLRERYFRGANIDELVAGWLRDTDGKTKPFLFHHDPVSSVTAVTGHNGGTTQSIKYGAFGTTLSTTGSSPNRLKYTGREDDGTGLYYYRARYLDPMTGRFISEDPLGFKAGPNFYAYANNNPINATDPYGFDTQYSVSLGGTAAMLFLGIGGNVSAGISIPDDLTNWRGYQVFGGMQANLMAGGGGYLGYGISVGKSESDGPLQPGITLDHGWYAEADAGIGSAAIGASLQGHGASFSSLPDAGSVTPLPKVGRGAGVWVSPIGTYGSATAASYTLGDIVDGVMGLFSADAKGGAAAGGGFLIYPNKPNNNMMTSVYSK